MKDNAYSQIYHWKDVIKRAEQIHGKNCDPYIFAKTVSQIATAAKLSSHDILELALVMGMKIYPRDFTFPKSIENAKRVITNLPKDWMPRISTTYHFSLSYHNPNDPLEYIAIVPPVSSGFRPYIIHHTSEGYVSPTWFDDVLPVLKQISYTKRPKNEVGKVFRNEKLTLGQVNTINHFFHEDPILKIAGVCTKCYRVSLPKKGFGVRYYFDGEIKSIPPQGIIKEIRLSARKGGYDRPYVTELVVAPQGMTALDENDNVQLTRKGDQIWRMIDPQSNNSSFSIDPEKRNVHIDASVYDFDMLTMRLPVCLCTP